jgi:predicted HTH transcriptional regulator
MLFPERPITAEHIRAFCSKFNEGYRVEYKSTFDGNVRDKIPKVLSSFANSHGGVLVVGVNTLNGVPQPPFQGFLPSPREEFPLTVENICLQNIHPPILPQTTFVESDIADHAFLVIEVDESAQAPHAIENSKKVYVRTGNAANPYDLADVDLVFDLAKRRKEPFDLRVRLLERGKKDSRRTSRSSTRVQASQT